MHDDPLERLSRVAAEDEATRLAGKLASNKRAVRRARRIRWALRGSILVFGTIGLVIAFTYDGREVLAWIACFGFFVALVSGAILFLMGGIAPWRVRKYLSERERRLLDD